MNAQLLEFSCWFAMTCLGGAMLIANSVGEEYQYLQVMGRGMGSQSMGKENGVTVDRQKPGDGQKPDEFVFDISRFFSESGMKP